MRLYIFRVLIIVGSMSNLAIAAPSCIDDDYYLTCYCDPKIYHSVCCNCPCWKYPLLTYRNQCVRCCHYHDGDMLDMYPGFARVKNDEGAEHMRRFAQAPSETISFFAITGSEEPCEICDIDDY
ncbi:hypothetical protein KG892_00320 [Vermiphilus pyriformis]|nr:MAG: hypothetical protein KG892_00320 [Vermiphilus pyriformis]